MKARGKAALLSRLEAEPKLILALDFDGTLAPVRPHPGRTRAAARTLRVLRRLAREPWARLAFVSGRGLADLRRKLPVPGAAYLANHGLQAQDARFAWTLAAARRARPGLARLARELERLTRGRAGVVMENKGLSLSIHYRRLRPPARVRDLAEAVDAAFARRSRGLRRSSGKKVWEFRPAQAWDKGRGLLHWKKARKIPGTLLFMGDDLTDEEGFRSLGAAGLSVKVGKGSTHGQYRLKQKEVVPFLEELLKTRGQRP